VSIYLPTHRRPQEGRSDQILFRNLCREAERVLERDLPGPITRELKDRLAAFDREEFWEAGRRSDGLAVFVCQGRSAAYRLPGRFPELQVVGASFHTKPLIRFLQGNSFAYYLLALNVQRVALYEGLGDAIVELPLDNVPQAPEEDQYAPIEVQHGVRQKGGARIHYGQGGRKEHAKEELEKFFRVVARELGKTRLKASSRPLVLAASAHHQPLFRKVAQLPSLLEEGVVVDPAKLTPDELKAEARRVLEPEIQRRIGRARDAFGHARSKGHGSDVLGDVAAAVVQGRVRTLLVESGRRIWGMLNPVTGEILPGDPARNAYDVDLLDELAEATLVSGGEVFVLTRDEMPTANGIAAVFRF
jgi:hypothetical protein